MKSAPVPIRRQLTAAGRRSAAVLGLLALSVSLAPARAGTTPTATTVVVEAQASDDDRDLFPTDPTPTVSVRPALDPRLGAATSYKLLRWADGSVMRWNPCAAIHYRVNLTDAPAGASRDVTAAIARVSALTGMTFVYDGPTRAIPQRGYGNAATPTSAPPLVIAWAKAGSGPGASNELPIGKLGVGGASGISWTDATGAHRMRSVTGLVVVNAAFNSLLAGFSATPGGARGGVLLHELGHVVGLDHVSDTTQEMNPVAIDRSSYGNGDTAGLAKLGVAAGCIR